MYVLLVAVIALLLFRKYWSRRKIVLGRAFAVGLAGVSFAV